MKAIPIYIYIIYILLFPWFAGAMGLLLAGIDRKVLAHMQRRIGPPIIQPFYDFMKLMGKETIVPDNASRAAFLSAPVVGVVSLLVTSLFIPFAGFYFPDTADIIVLIYLLTIPAVAIIIGGAASGSPFAGIGISREMVALISYELPLIMVFLTVGKKAAMDGGMTFSMAAILEYQTKSGMMITHWAMIPAAIAFLLIIPGEVGTQPFDVAEAETEICEGTMAEYSGAPLAIFELSHAIKMFIMTALFTALFLSGWTTGFWLLDAVIVIAICIVVTVISMTLPHASAARLKVEWLFRYYWQVVAGLALVSLILVWLGL